MLSLFPDIDDLNFVYLGNCWWSWIMVCRSILLETPNNVCCQQHCSKARIVSHFRSLYDISHALTNCCSSASCDWNCHLARKTQIWTDLHKFCFFEFVSQKSETILRDLPSVTFKKLFIFKNLNRKVAVKFWLWSIHRDILPHMGVVGMVKCHCASDAHAYRFCANGSLATVQRSLRKWSACAEVTAQKCCF